MKKVILGLFLIFFFPYVVDAANYTITDQLIQAEIQENGDLMISELIVMDGTFNGYVKELSYANTLIQDEYSSYEKNSIYNAKGIELISIKGKNVDEVDFDTFDDTNFKNFTLDYSAKNGDTLKYTVQTDYTGYDYTLYYASNHDKVAFLITYMIDSVVVYHQDVAELYWNFITPNDYDDIENVQVKVLLPGVDDSNYLKVWAHGDLSGDVKILDENNGVLAVIPHMESSSVLDIRLTFNKNLITDVSKVKKSGDVVLEDIIEVENERAEVANQLRDQLKRERNFVIGYSWILLVYVVIGTIFVYFKYGKSPKATYYSKYNREFIDDYNVEVIDYLMKRNITPNALSASIMNLIYKKNIRVKEIESSKKKEKDYEFTLESTENLSGSENLLTSFLFDTVSGGKLNDEQKKVFTTLDLKKYANGTKTCSQFISSYTAWKNSVLKEGANQQFFSFTKKSSIMGSIALVLAIILLFLTMSFGVDYILTYVVIFMAILFFIYGIVVYKRTIKGSEHYARWKAFRNFLDDFGAFELKELPEIILWERYLVYATIFGLADKVQKSMNVRISELDMSGLPNDYYPVFTYIHISPMIHSSFNNAIQNAYQRQSANYANTHSRYSSGGGFGGGFSSGGGFGGGGSSGHGF